MNNTIILYKKLVDENPNFKAKGKTTSYTSSNGYMFSFVNKANEIGIRLSKEDTKIFGENYTIQPFISHGAKMRDYVLIPEEALNYNWNFITNMLQKSFEYVNSLPEK